MFKALEKYLGDYETELREDYLRARKAYHDWCSEHVKQSTSVLCQINGIDKDFWGRYIWTPVSENVRVVDEPVSSNKVNGNLCVVVDEVKIDGISYKIEVAHKYIPGSDEEDRFLAEYECKNILSKYNGYFNFLQDREVYIQDVELCKYRDEKWCIDRAHKDAVDHGKWIEGKIKKLLVGVEEIEEYGNCDWLIKGTNGKTAHMWFITAGGYNIQRKHVRCLLKEVNSKK